MEYRPWFIIVLSVIIALIPVQNILLFSVIYDQTLIEFFADLYHFQSGFDLACFFLLPLISAYALYAVKKWSFAVFFAAYSFFTYQTYMTGTFPVVFNDMSLMALGLVINLLLIAYFLLPTVRAAYFDPRLRWWESKYRYKVEMDAEITANNRMVRGKISDISEGGVFIVPDSPIDLASELVIKFTYHTMDFLMHGKVAHDDGGAASSERTGYGIVFSEVQKENQKKLGNLIQALELLEVPRRPKRREWKKDFWGWLVKLVTTGNGITPDLPSKYLRGRS